jgi:Filamin/ABP280 repeat
VGRPLAESLAVKAVDQFGKGVAGVAVSWEAIGGSVSAASVTTGPDGRSAVLRTLGDQPGSYGTTATATGLDGSPVSFTATAGVAPSPALVLVTQPSPAASAGVPFAQQPELQLQDPFGAPLNQADVRVTAGISTGAGSLAGGTSARSDASGRVRFVDLSIRGEPGARKLIFAAESFSPAISGSIVVAPGPPSPDRSSATVPNGTAGVATSISIHLEDEFGTAVEGAAGSIAVAVTGANQVSSLPVTDQGNGSYSASYTPTNAGTDQAEVRLGGTAVSGSPFTSIVVPGPASRTTTTADVSRQDFFFYYSITIVVTTRDAQGNPVGRGGDHVEVQPSGAAVRDAEDLGDGTYVSAFSTFDPNHPSDIFLNGEPLAGNPFSPP